MKLKPIFLVLVCCTTIISYSQIQSGIYDSGLKIAYNMENKLLTGFYEDYTGYDEDNNSPRFSCIFYIIGKYDTGVVVINTFYPNDEIDDLIKGTLKINDSVTLSVSLPEEHGGCWNVMHFADGEVNFTLADETNWIEIRYITSEKAYFYSDTNESSKMKSYLIKGDLVYINEISDDMAKCKYYGNTITEGWIKKECLNPLN